MWWQKSSICTSCCHLGRFPWDHLVFRLSSAVARIIYRQSASFPNCLTHLLMYRPPGALRALWTCVAKVFFFFSFCLCVYVCRRCDLQFAVMHKNTHQPQFTLTFSLCADERKMMGFFCKGLWEKMRSVYLWIFSCVFYAFLSDELRGIKELNCNFCWIVGFF